MSLITKLSKTSAFEHQSERGVALVLVMIFLMIMTVLGLAITMSGITEVNVGRNTRLTTEAFDTAESGVSDAYELIRNMRGDFTDLIRGSDNGKVSWSDNLAALKNGDEFQQW